MEFKRCTCTVIDMRWKRKLGSRLSPEIDAILRPSSEKKATDDSFNGPSVSAAIGWNRRPVCLLLLSLFIRIQSKFENSKPQTVYRNSVEHASAVEQ